MMSVPSFSPSIKPLMYKAHEKSDKDDNWPKNIIGACMIYVKASKKYVLIGGNFNALENIKKNFQINREIIAGIDKNIENFYELEQKKIEYLTESVLNNSQSQKFIDIFVYETQPVRKWYKVSTLGRTPKARSFHKCIVMGNYIFLFGGVELGSKGENNSQNDLYVFNLLTYEWKLVICKKYPYDRCDFGWTHLEKIGILYGGAGSPNEIYFDDMWLFKYDDFDISKESKKEIQKDYWSEITQYGNIPGKIRAFSMEYSVIDSSLYLFGGLDSRGKNRNDLYRYEISCSTWNIVSTKGKGPSERCYHEMALINKDYFVLYGGINGTLSKIDYIHNDLFLYNINELVWVQPIIGGVTPSPKFGFSFCSNYDFNQMEIIILGGYSKDYESSTSSNNKFMKVFSLCENDSDSNYLWNVRDLKYREEQNDENFIIQSEQSIHEYKDRINTLEIEIRNKEISIVEMKQQIEDFKKKIFKSHGYIDDQSQTLEEHIKELTIQKSNIKESLEIDKKITHLKLKLKFIMQRKVQKTMEFFCSNQNLFIKYYDALVKMQLNNVSKELDSLYSKQTLDKIKAKYSDRLSNLKNRLENLNGKEEVLSTDLHRYKKYEKNVDELFKEEIEKYKIVDDSMDNI